MKEMMFADGTGNHVRLCALGNIRSYPMKAITMQLKRDHHPLIGQTGMFVWVRCFQLLTQATSTSKLDRKVWNTLFGALARANAWQHALHFILRCPDEALRCCDKLSVVDPPMFVSAMAACSRASKWQWALFLQDTVVPSLSSIALFNAGLAACAKGSQWLRSLRALQMFPKATVVSYNSAINACANGYAWSVALMLLDTMEELHLTATVEA
eukprot:symbB.v1.2.001354.t3/scaffold69.1/size353428/9